jgi:RecB family exonuclease
MSDHSLISPSMVHRMIQCPGSVLAGKDMPDSSSPAAERGTLIHHLSEEMLRIGFTDATELTPEEHENLRAYCRYVKEQAEPKHSVLYIEHVVSLEQYVDDMFGSIDALIVGDGIIHVIDLKTGARHVSAKDNPQLMSYLLGATAAYDAWESNLKMTIWQGGVADTVQVTPEELEGFSKTLMASAAIALKENAPRNPSDDACRYCKAAPECPALYSQQLAVIGGDFNDLTTPDKLTDEQIRTVVLNRSRVEKWMKEVWSYALERTHLNKPIDGVKVVEGRAMRRWHKTGKEALVEYLGDEAYTKKLIGVTEADKLLGKELVNSMTERKGSPTLVGLDDPRPALTNAAEDFDCI